MATKLQSLKGHLAKEKLKPQLDITCVYVL